MDLWVIWVLIAVAFLAGEIATFGFVLAPFAGGALLAAVVDLAGAPAGASATVFLAASVALFVGVRPIAKRHLRSPPGSRTGTQRLLGERALVLEAVGDDAGLIKLDGEQWTARSYEPDGAPIPAGTRVEVIEIRGATALVSE